MRHSPRKRSGASSCSTPVEIFSFQQLNTIPLGELRHLASEKHGIKNAVVLKKPELLSKLKEHFESRHGQELNDEKEEVVAELSPISQTIDKLRSRIKVHIFFQYSLYKEYFSFAIWFPNSLAINTFFLTSIIHLFTICFLV